MLYAQRERFAGFSEGVGRLFSRLPLSANQWTMLSLVAIAACVFFILSHVYMMAAFFLLVAGFVDVVDGAVARFTKTATPRGAYLDTVIDRYVEGAVAVALLFIPAPSLFLPFSAWVGIYLIGAFMTTYVKAAAKEKELTKHDIRGGIAERSERLLLLFVGLLLGSFNLTVLAAFIVVLAVVSHITALQRLRIVKHI